METGERLKRNEPGINTFAFYGKQTNLFVAFLGESTARANFVFGFI